MSYRLLKHPFSFGSLYQLLWWPSILWKHDQVYVSDCIRPIMFGALETHLRDVSLTEYMWKIYGHLDFAKFRVSEGTCILCVIQFPLLWLQAAWCYEAQLEDSSKGYDGSDILWLVSFVSIFSQHHTNHGQDRNATSYMDFSATPCRS